MTADIVLGHTAAFVWDSKGRAILKSFTCDCGENIVTGTEDGKYEVTEGFDITCSECNKTYYAEFLVKLVPYEDVDDKEAPGEGSHHNEPAGLVQSGAEGEQVKLCYESSVSKNTKVVRGTLEETDSTTATVKVGDDESHGQPGDEFTVYSSKSKARDAGVVTKNSRKVGTFEEADEE